MFENLHDLAFSAWQADYTATVRRIVSEGKTREEALELARAEVLTRRGEPPTLAKVLADQGGPLSGQV